MVKEKNILKKQHILWRTCFLWSNEKQIECGEITLHVGFQLKAGEYIMQCAMFIWCYFFFSTLIFWRGMPTDCKLCCRGGNATRIEPSWATKLWLWELSIWLRYNIVPWLGHHFQPFHFIFHFHVSTSFCSELVIAFCFSLTVSDMAISIY